MLLKMALLHSFLWLSSIPLLEKEMATHSSILAWRIPWMEEPGRLQSMGLQRVRHDWAAERLHFQYSIVCMYHIFICSSVDGYLGCFCVWDICLITLTSFRKFIFFAKGKVLIQMVSWESSLGTEVHSLNTCNHLKDGSSTISRNVSGFLFIL